MIEIGSNYHLDENIANINDLTENMCCKKNTYFLDSGRSAIKLIINSLDDKNRTVLLPEYTCESVIFPFIECGFNVLFYHVSKNMTIDCLQLKTRIIESNPSIILVHSYFGLSDSILPIDILLFIKDKGILLIEDITQNMFSENKLEISDFQIGSLRKWLPIPDGGVIIDKNSIGMDLTKLDKGINEDVVLSNLYGLINKREYIIQEQIEYKDCSNYFFIKSKKELNKQRKIYEISKYSKKILSVFDFDTMKQKRRENYNYLFNKLQYSQVVSSVFGTCSEKNVPLFFPLYVNCDRTILQKYMAENRVYMPIIWPKSTYLENNEIGRDAEYIYDSILCIPIDHRYGILEMNKIIDLLIYFEKYGG